MKQEMPGRPGIGSVAPNGWRIPFPVGTAFRPESEPTALLVSAFFAELPTLPISA
ncbi:hypothetical protein ACGFOU_10685 [Streptomyces sp. NPDC048595]|uniref:hypothetical protein n=1 Tax=Streptomyces sp. NPDC048595 TaxID=3365576 RepID=UPI00371777CF